MKFKFGLLWASVFAGALLWFSLGLFMQKGTLRVFSKPNITGVWTVDLQVPDPDPGISRNIITSLVITDKHIEWAGGKTEYKAHYEGDIIVVKTPVPDESKAKRFSEEVIFLIKKDSGNLKVIAVGVSTDVDLKKFES